MYLRRSILGILFLIGLFVFMPGQTAKAAPAAQCASVQSGDWSDSATWDNCDPAGKDVKIADGHIVTVDDSTATAKSVEVQPGGTLLIPPSGTLTTDGEIKAKGVDAVINVTGGVINSTGKLKAENGGTINISSGTVIVDNIEVKDDGTAPTAITISGGAVTTTETGNDSVKVESPNAVLTVEGTGSLTIAGQLKLKKEGTVVLPDIGGAAILTAEIVQNTGTLRQSGTATTSEVAFVNIKNANGDSVYQGADLTLVSGTAIITVEVRGRIGIGGDFTGATCTTDSGDNYRDRCFKIESDTAVQLTTDSTFYTTAEEDDINNDALFQAAAPWDNRGTCSDTADGAPCSPNVVIDLIAGNNYFLIADGTDAPTALTLNTLMATTDSQSQLAVLVLGVLAVLIGGTALVLNKQRISHG